MNILIIDTATEACSVALEVNKHVFNRFEVCPQQHSQRILPMIDDVLKEANVTLQDLDYLAFGRGPGSFTGVRIATGVIHTKKALRHTETEKMGSGPVPGPRFSSFCMPQGFLCISQTKYGIIGAPYLELCVIMC